MKTTQITVRNVDPVLKRRFDKLAALKSMSINDLALEALREKVGDVAVPKKSSALQKYFGAFSKDAFNQAVLDDFETIDEVMWA